MVIRKKRDFVGLCVDIHVKLMNCESLNLIKIFHSPNALQIILLLVIRIKFSLLVLFFIDSFRSRFVVFHVLLPTFFVLSTYLLQVKYFVRIESKSATYKDGKMKGQRINLRARVVGRAQKAKFQILKMFTIFQVLELFSFAFFYFFEIFKSYFCLRANSGSPRLCLVPTYAASYSLSAE